jgi:hypothetical protein
MKRRGCGVGGIVTLLGLVLSCCLLPYLISSIYSIVSAILQVPGAPNWLWGDWIGSLVDSGTPLYMFLSEGPICCVGTLGLFIVIFGVILMVGGLGGRRPAPAEDEYQETGYQDGGYEDGDYLDSGYEGEYGEFEEYDE